MDTPMSLEEYKQKAIAYHKKMYPTSTVALSNLQKMSDELWRMYMEDFSPEVAVQGMASGLI